MRNKTKAKYKKGEREKYNFKGWQIAWQAHETAETVERESGERKRAPLRTLPVVFPSRSLAESEENRVPRRFNEEMRARGQRRSLYIYTYISINDFSFDLEAY